MRPCGLLRPPGTRPVQCSCLARPDRGRRTVRALPNPRRFDCAMHHTLSFLLHPVSCSTPLPLPTPPAGHAHTTDRGTYCSHPPVILFLVIYLFPPASSSSARASRLIRFSPSSATHSSFFFFLPPSSILPAPASLSHPASLLRLCRPRPPNLLHQIRLRVYLSFSILLPSV